MFSHHSQNVGSIVWTGRTNVLRTSKKFEILTWKIRLKANYLEMFSEISRSLVLPFLHPQIKFLNASFLDLSQGFITLLDSQQSANLFLSYDVCYKRQGHGIHRRRRTAAQQYGRVTKKNHAADPMPKLAATEKVVCNNIHPRDRVFRPRWFVGN